MILEKEGEKSDNLRSGPINFSTTVQFDYVVDCNAGPVNTTFCYFNDIDDSGNLKEEWVPSDDRNHLNQDGHDNYADFFIGAINDKYSAVPYLQSDTPCTGSKLLLDDDSIALQGG